MKEILEKYCKKNNKGYGDYEYVLDESAGGYEYFHYIFFDINCEDNVSISTSEDAIVTIKSPEKLEMFLKAIS